MGAVPAFGTPFAKCLGRSRMGTQECMGGRSGWGVEDSRSA